MYTPTKFELSQRYGQILCVCVLHHHLLCRSAPLFPFAAMLFFLLYIVDKYMLLNTSKRPPMYDYKLNDLFLTCAVRLLVAPRRRHVLGHHNLRISLPRLTPSRENTAWLPVAVVAAGEHHDYHHGLHGKARSVRRDAPPRAGNALLPFAFFVVLMAALFVAKFFNTGIFSLVCTHCA